MLNGEQAVSKTAVAGFDPRATCKRELKAGGLSHQSMTPSGEKLARVNLERSAERSATSLEN